jgi:uncharacterized protein (TIGR02266 family)
MTSVSNQRPASGGNDRRDNLRSGYDIQVGVATDHRLFVGLTANISNGGLFIASDEPFKKGDKVEVRFSIPGANHVFHKHATVCWTRPFDASGGHHHTKAGAGVRFDDLSDEESRILDAFLKVHEPIFFDV